MPQRIPMDGSPPRGIWLRWEALVFEVALPRDGAKRILHGLSGQLLPAQLMAVMGPSGSGKTSLMKLLAGRRPPTAGALLVNGEPMHVPTMRRASGFVAQTTVFLDTLTVRETVTFTAMLRLDRSVPVASKRARVEQVLQAVDLAKCADSRIGNDLTGGISGGERRRLSIVRARVRANAACVRADARALFATLLQAVEVVHKPLMLLLDEPTSGLDATSAQMVGDALRRMSAADGTSSLCSIHQPRASLLAVFDVLLLLAEGRVVYNGPINLAGDGGVLEYFVKNGFACPALENPADWLLDLVHGAEAGGAETPAKQDVEAAAADMQAGRVARAERFAALYAASPLAAASMQPPADPPAPLPAAGRGSEHGLFPTSWWTQFSAIWRRTLLYKLREPAAVMTQASTAVVMPLIVGGIFWSISLSQSAVSDRLAAVSFTVLMQAFVRARVVGIAARLHVLMQAPFSLRFRRCALTRSCCFRASAPCTCATTRWACTPPAPSSWRAPWPRCPSSSPSPTSAPPSAISVRALWIPQLACALTHLAAAVFGFQRDGRKYLIFVAIICTVTEAGAALLTSLGALSPDMETGNLLATLLIVILTLLDGACSHHVGPALRVLTALRPAGFYRNLADVPLWCRWVSSFSFLGYGVQAAAVNEFRGLTFTCTEEEARTGCIPDGDAFLRRQSLDGTSIGANIGYIILLAVGSRFVAYLALRFLYTGQSFRERLAQP